MNDKSYELPKDLNKTIELIKAIPDNWASIRGALEANDGLKNSGKVAQRNFLAFQRRHDEPFIHGKPYQDPQYRTWHKKPADLVSLFCERKFPEMILFDDAGYENKPRNLSTLKDLIIHWLQIGFAGRLQFIANFVDNNANAYTADVTFFLMGLRTSTIKKHIRETELFSAALKISGSDAALKPIFDYIELFDLQESVVAARIMEPLDTLIPGRAEFRKKRGLDNKPKTD